ncbi:MAG: hypothetical protein V1790_17380 [Planctomycetota bacterium]
MSRRTDLDWAYSLSPLTMERLGRAWELGRIAGVREAARLGVYRRRLTGISPTALRAYARKLKRGLE